MTWLDKSLLITSTLNNQVVEKTFYPSMFESVAVLRDYNSTAEAVSYIRQEINFNDFSIGDNLKASEISRIETKLTVKSVPSILLSYSVPLSSRQVEEYVNMASKQIAESLDYFKANNFIRDAKKVMLDGLQRITFNGYKETGGSSRKLPGIFTPSETIDKVELSKKMADSSFKEFLDQMQGFVSKIWENSKGIMPNTLVVPHNYMSYFYRTDKINSPNFLINENLKSLLKIFETPIDVFVSPKYSNEDGNLMVLYNRDYVYNHLVRNVKPEEPTYDGLNIVYPFTVIPAGINFTIPESALLIYDKGKLPA